jgi:hydroxymethylpyrimidine/phosphomethylpyrimidine kinase
MPSQPPIVLTIAGFDPSSGAGITADIKTIAAHECFGIACITALTVQSTQGVRRVETVAPETVSATLEELVSDFEIAAVHVGMLGTEQMVATVAAFLDRVRLPHVVLDPILRSSSGAELLNLAGRQLMAERLFPLAEVVTPNLDEAVVLTGMELASGAAATAPLSGSSGTVSLGQSMEAMREAAERLHALGAANVVVTGGHLEKAIDLLSFTTDRGVEQEVFKSERQRSSSTHGTGCAFATALASHLAHGRGLPEAVLLAKAYISAAIANAQGLGRGVGPLHHLYRMHEQRRPVSTVTEKEQSHSRS